MDLLYVAIPARRSCGRRRPGALRHWAGAPRQVPGLPRWRAQAVQQQPHPRRGVILPSGGTCSMVVLGTPGLVREHHGGHGARCIASALCAISPAAIRAGT